MCAKYIKIRGHDSKLDRTFKPRGRIHILYIYQPARARVIYIYILFFNHRGNCELGWTHNDLARQHANCRAVKNIINSVPPTLNCFRFYQRVTRYIIIFRYCSIKSLLWDLDFCWKNSSSDAPPQSDRLDPFKFLYFGSRPISLLSAANKILLWLTGTSEN